MNINIAKNASHIMKGGVIMKLKIDPTKSLSIGMVVLNVAGVLLSSIVHKNETKAMKSELKDELMKEIFNEKN